MLRPYTVDPEKIAYSVAEAATVTSVSARTICTYISQGSLKSLKVGGRRLILRRDLERFLEGVA